MGGVVLVSIRPGQYGGGVSQRGGVFSLSLVHYYQRQNNPTTWLFQFNVITF